jgi:hypothetical protein
MSKNKSAVYGYYGGVSNENHYVPPGSPGFVPQPPKTTFTEKDRQLVEQLIDQTAFYVENAPNILVRKLVSSIDNNGDNIDSFVMSTSAKPEDVIVYTSDTNTVDLNHVDAGYF